LGFYLKKLLITGASGYLGARLSKYLAENGYKVTAFDNSKPTKHNRWLSLMEEVIIGDIRDEAVISSLGKRQFDAIIHLISLDHKKSEDNPSIISSINVLSTWNLLEKFKNNSLSTFIYFSTFQVYGKVPAEIITSEFVPLPQNNYGLTHLLSENICNYYNVQSDINCINIRLTNSYGSPVFKENNCWWLVINDLCRTAYKKKKIKLLSDGSPQRDFIHSTDVCRAVELLLCTEKKNMKNNTINVSSGETLTIWELANAVRKIYKKRYNDNIPISLPDGVSKNHAEEASKKTKYAVDNSNLKTMGFTRQTDLESGINEVFDYLERNNEG